MPHDPDRRGVSDVVRPAPLPGEHAPRRDLVDEAVVQLNRLDAVSSLERACAVGRYLLDIFFDGDPTVHRERRREHRSFAALVGRPDLQLSKSALSRSIGIVEQLADMPDDVATALSYTHHVLLLPVSVPQDKARLAWLAARQGWTKRRLEIEIARWRQESTRASARPGPRPLPPDVRALRSVARAACRLPQPDAVGAVWLSAPSSERAHLLSQVQRASARLADIAETLATLDQ